MPWQYSMSSNGDVPLSDFMRGLQTSYPILKSYTVLFHRGCVHHNELLCFSIPPYYGFACKCWDETLRYMYVWAGLVLSCGSRAQPADLDDNFWHEVACMNCGASWVSDRSLCTLTCKHQFMHLKSIQECVGSSSLSVHSSTLFANDGVSVHMC